MAVGSTLAACGFLGDPGSSGSEIDKGGGFVTEPAPPPQSTAPGPDASMSQPPPAMVDAGGGHDATTIDAPPTPLEAGPPDVSADAPPPYCGDGVVNQPTEQCDDGPTPPPRGLCTLNCRVQEQLLVAPAVDGGAPSRSLGRGRHPIASQAGALAVAYTETTDQETQLLVKLHDAHDIEGPPVPLAPPSAALASANPVVAGLPAGVFAIAFTTPSSSPGDATDVVLRQAGATGLIGGALTANAGKVGEHYDADVVWTGTDLVVAWTDTSTVGSSPDLRMRRFDAQLNPRTAGDEDLAVTADVEGDVALAAFGGTWAAAWRASASDGEYIRARTPTASWSLGPYLAGPDQARPALVPVDGSHLLVIYVQGRDALDAGVATTSTLRGVLLDAGAGTAGAPFDITAPKGALIEALDVNASSAGNVIAVGWRSPAVSGSALGEDVSVAYWSNVTGPPDLQAPLSPTPVPRLAAHRNGDQRALALAPIADTPAQFFAAWDDLGMTFGAGEGPGDVVVLRLPALHTDPTVADDIVIDATALTEQQVQLVGLAIFDSKTPQHVAAAPGSYPLFTAGGYVLGPGGTVRTVVVKNDGTIDYDPSLDGVYAGRGTTTLTVKGLAIAVDATVLTEQQVKLVGMASADNKTVYQATVTPGSYGVYTAGASVPGPGGMPQSLVVKNDGTVDYDVSLNSVYGGRGTTTLTVKGFGLTVDATALNKQQMQLVGAAIFDSKTVQNLTVAAGTYAVYTSGGYVFAPGGSARSVAVKNDGTIDYDASLNGIYGGRGTTTLTVNGLAVTVDATPLSEQQMQLVGVTSFDSKTVQHVTVTPGSYDIYTAGGGYVFGPNGNVRTVVVKNDGTVDYDVSLNGVYGGRGTTTLTVNGLALTVDATALSEQHVQLVGVATFDSKTAQHVTIVPGSYGIYTPGGYVYGPTGGTRTVVVKNDGTIDYDASLNGAYSGRGTSALTVVGFAIRVDATAHPSQSYDVAGVTLWFGGSAVKTIQISPGKYTVNSQSLGQLGAFTVQPAGTIDFDPSLNTVFSGRGTTTLTIP
jgi:phenolic acid decarboxylase